MDSRLTLPEEQTSSWLDHKASVEANDMIDVSDNDGYQYHLIQNKSIPLTDNNNQDIIIKNPNIDKIIGESDMIDPDQPEGINEKQAMKTELMKLLKHDTENIQLNKDKLDMKNHLLYLQQEQEKSEMRIHLYHLKKQISDKLQTNIIESKTNDTTDTE